MTLPGILIGAWPYRVPACTWKQTTPTYSVWTVDQATSFGMLLTPTGIRTMGPLVRLLSSRTRYWLQPRAEMMEYAVFSPPLTRRLENWRGACGRFRLRENLVLRAGPAIPTFTVARQPGCPALTIPS